MENPESLIYLTDVTVTDIFYNTLPLHPHSTLPLCVWGGGTGYEFIHLHQHFGTASHFVRL